MTGTSLSVGGRGGGGSTAPEGTVCLRVGREGLGHTAEMGFTALAKGAFSGVSVHPPCKCGCIMVLWSAFGGQAKSKVRLYLIMVRLVSHECVSEHIVQLQ